MKNYFKESAEVFKYVLLDYIMYEDVFLQDLDLIIENPILSCKRRIIISVLG